MNFGHASELLELCHQYKASISEIMILREVYVTGKSRDMVIAQMQEALSVMKQSVVDAQANDRKMLGGFIGGESKALLHRIEKKGPMGGVISKAAAYAMGVLELNASMGRIVAAPTAGAAGVLPGVLLAMQEEYNFTDHQLLMALFNAGAIGYLISENATVAGAEGGCQAEVGAACCMAASAICELFEGTPEICLAAAGDAMANILGLVCDPICGLVEAPCQKRNAMGVSNAIISAEVALATNGKTLVPFDEVIEAMYSVGKSLPYTLRETALGGIAACKSVRGRRPAGDN